MKLDELLGGVKTVGIAGHIRPDGDCTGACMGVYLYIKKNFPKIKVDVFLDEVIPELAFIKDSNEVKIDFESDVESYDMFFVLDCSKDRIGGAEKFFDSAKRTVNIDHHVSNKGTGDELLIHRCKLRM